MTAPNEPTQETTEPAMTETEVVEAEVDWKAEAEKFKAEAEKFQQHSRTWEQRAKGNQTAAEKKLAEIEAEKLSDLEKAQKDRDDLAKRLAEVEKTSRDRVITSAVRELAAAQNFHDPADALAQLGSQLAEIPLDESGEIDRDALQTALTALAVKKPYLVAATGPRAPQPDPAQGARGNTAATAEEAEYQKHAAKLRPSYQSQ